MADKMLIDASHAEETRVVVVRGNRIEEFDFESATQEADPRQYLSRKSNERRALAAGRFRRLRRQSPRLPGLRRNPSRLLPDPARRPAGPAAGRSRGAAPRRRCRACRDRHRSSTRRRRISRISASCQTSRKTPLPQRNRGRGSRGRWQPPPRPTEEAPKPRRPSRAAAARRQPPRPRAEDADPSDGSR